MSGVDVFENLDNNALRAKCLEYGLPNVPITDTSRKLLIRRLRVAIEAGDKPQENNKPVEKEKQKSRRETIHATKVATTETKKEVKVDTPTKSRAAARRTIAATESRVHEDSPVKPKTPAQNRRTSRNTPISQPEEIIEPLKRKATVIEEEEDDDTEEDEVVIIEDPVPPRSTRSSRSSSLSKSPVVRTSFSHVQPDPIEDYEQEIEWEEEPVKEHIIWPKHVPSTRTYDTSKPFVPTVTRENPLSYTNSTSLNHLGTKMNLSQAPTSTFSYDSSDYRRSYEDFKTTQTKTPMKIDASRETEPDDGLKSRYLSDFARRLSRLKAEPLEPVLAVKREISQQREIHRHYPSTVGGRRSISQKDSVGESFQKLLLALDHKYNLRRNLFIGGAAFVFILAYILFAY